MQGFVNASYRAMVSLKENRSESIKLLAKFQRRDEQSAGRVFDLDITSFGGDGRVHCDVVEKGLDLQKEFIGAASPVPCERVINNQFAQPLSKSLRVPR